jgi:hypothetical protein
METKHNFTKRETTTLADTVISALDTIRQHETTGHVAVKNYGVMDFKREGLGYISPMLRDLLVLKRYEGLSPQVDETFGKLSEIYKRIVNVNYPRPKITEHGTV